MQSSQNSFNRGGRILLSNYDTKYFTISGAQTNYDVKTQQSTFTQTARRVKVYVNVAATVKINSSSNAAIQLIAGEDQDIDFMEVTNLFITTTADTVVRVILWW